MRRIDAPEDKDITCDTCPRLEKAWSRCSFKEGTISKGTSARGMGCKVHPDHPDIFDAQSNDDLIAQLNGLPMSTMDLAAQFEYMRKILIEACKRTGYKKPRFGQSKNGEKIFEERTEYGWEKNLKDSRPS